MYSFLKEQFSLVIYFPILITCVKLQWSLDLCLSNIYILVTQIETLSQTIEWEITNK